MGRIALLIILSLSTVSSAQCPFTCGDCDRDGSISILDALRASQLAVGLITPTTDDQCCDVAPPYASGGPPRIDIIDALFIALAWLGVPIPLVCL